jgi:UPF0755 protein
VGARSLARAAAGASAAALVLAACGGGSAVGTTAATTTDASPKVLHIIFPEGFTREEMAARITAVSAIARKRRGIEPALTASAYLAATRSSALPGEFAGDGKRRSLEGFLFPAVYAFFSNERAPRFVKRQLDAFRQNWARVDMRYARSKNLTAYDVITIASMIEREVAVPGERRLVAAVIYNRLHLRMPLGIDATLRYGLHIPPTKSITKTDLASDSPYNSRRFPGLPPTPIGNPGLASLQAAAHPAKVDYVYFVRKPDKRHHYFTASYSDFERYLSTHGYGG